MIILGVALTAAGIEGLNVNVLVILDS